jgi:hypothetical protein
MKNPSLVFAALFFCALKASAKPPCAPKSKGPDYLNVMVYKQMSGIPFVDERVADAAGALSLRGFGLNDHSGYVRGYRDVIGKASTVQFPDIEAPADLCVVVKDAFSMEDQKPRDMQLPIFFVKIAENLKKTLFGTETVGKTFGPGVFKSVCDSLGVDGLPPNTLIVIDSGPEQVHRQVLIHEIGHAVSFSVPHASKAIFEHRTAPDAKNIMVTHRGLEKVEDMQMTDAQVEVLCRSPYHQP